MIKILVFLIILNIESEAVAAPKYEMRGFLSSKVMRYTGDAVASSGQKFRAQFEHLAIYNEKVSLVNQARWNYSSTYTDLSTSPSLTLPIQKENLHDFYAGENYLKIQSSSWVMQAGYQEISWGEAFGFNYADLVNPKDQTATAYADVSESKLPLLLLNTKYFYSFDLFSDSVSGSVQLLYSPEPRFSKTLPLSLFTNSLFPTFNFIVRKESTPSLFKHHEYGGKFSITAGGYDLSLSTYSSLDRSPFYVLESATGNSITVRESHPRIKSHGVSLAKALFDNFVFRTDAVYHQNRVFNTITSGQNLSSLTTDELNLLISIDTPTYESFSGAMIFASSTLQNGNTELLREKKEQYAIGKISYDLGAEKIIDLSYTHEINVKGHAAQGQFGWPINDHFDFRVGAEIYWGKNNSNFQRIKNISNVFFSIKNYFQL